MFSFSCFQLFQEIENVNHQFLFSKRLNHVFGNKFKCTNNIETQFPSYMYNKRIPNFLMIYNITILQNSMLLPGFMQSPFMTIYGEHLGIQKISKSTRQIETHLKIRMKHMHSLKL